MTISRQRALSRSRNEPHASTLIFLTLSVVILLLPMGMAGQRDVAPVSLSQVPLELKPFVVAPGQRLQKPGKERIAMAGVITHYGDTFPQSERVRVVLQYPANMRLERDESSWLFDANDSRSAAFADPRTAAVFQTMLEDSVEGFFALQKDRITRRYLGSGFRLEGGRESDPGMDVVLMTFPGAFRDNELVSKSYWFDSLTKLLGVVAYRSPSGVVTHTVIEDWREIDGEMLPFRIERWEDGKLTMRFAVESASFSSMAGNEDRGRN